MPASSTPVSVIILKVEPGGCTLFRPMPATAVISPVEGRITTMPPSWPPRAVTAARCSAGEIVVRTAVPRRAGGKRRLALEHLPVAQAGECQGARPGDRRRPLSGTVAPADRQGEGEGERAEQPRAHAHGHLEGVTGGAARSAGHPPRERG